MKATQTSKTIIVLSRVELEEIVKQHLEMKHLTVDSMCPRYETVYDGSPGDPGTEELRGYRIVANTNIKEFEL